jgi:NAD(P)-dependent dehydrogenase (short-subunit alcohol dehydrogenase family)
VELKDRVAIVTGGASGIGRALAQRFANEGARGVVVADLDGAGAEEVASGIGSQAIGVKCDVASDAETNALIDRAEDAFGPVDVFCANAGIGIGTYLDTPDEEWDLAFNVNIRAHILAARRLVPGWLERGEGYFVTTASAAGLLTQIGSAPYSVTKHAAVAFAEWLSVTYGDQGVKVSCLCPMGVNTAMLQAGLKEPGAEGVGVRIVQATSEVLEPEDVAGVAVDAMRDERFLILPHPQVLEYFSRKSDDYDRWLAGMRRLQAQVAGQPAADS